MWMRVVLGVNTYYVIQWFIIYSMLGWLVESIYMSICNKKLTNRGFTKGPFCPIYGFGALSVYFLLRPLMPNYIMLYFCGALLATTLEFLTAKLMIALFGEVWWDYNDKPFNYKGILCLESTIAWGVYTIFLFVFLQGFVMKLVNSYDHNLGVIFGRVIIIGYFLDFTYQLYKIVKDGKDARTDLA